MPGFGGFEALRLLQQTGKDLPFILVSAVVSEETAVAAMKAGAHDYIMKRKLARLVPAIERAPRPRILCETCARELADLVQLYANRAEADPADAATAATLAGLSYRLRGRP